MLYLAKGTENIIVVTLSERVTISQPYYLFVIEGKGRQADIKLIVSDFSEYPYRYNKFSIIEGVNFTLPNHGEYNYRFIQKTTASTDILSDDVVLERGILKVLAPVVKYSHTKAKNTVINGQ